LCHNDRRINGFPTIKGSGSGITWFSHEWGSEVIVSDKNSLFVGRSIGDFALCVNGKGSPLINWKDKMRIISAILVLLLVTCIPMIFMLIMTGWAMILNIQKFYSTSNWLLFFIGLAVFVLEIWMIIESVVVLKTVYARDEGLPQAIA